MAEKQATKMLLNFFDAFDKFSCSNLIKFLIFSRLIG